MQRNPQPKLRVHPRNRRTRCGPCPDRHPGRDLEIGCTGLPAYPAPHCFTWVNNVMHMLLPTQSSNIFTMFLRHSLLPFVTLSTSAEPLTNVTISIWIVNLRESSSPLRRELLLDIYLSVHSD